MLCSTHFHGTLKVRGLQHPLELEYGGAPLGAPRRAPSSCPPPTEVNCMILSTICILFCNKLSEMDGLNKVYTLPDELEQILTFQLNAEDSSLNFNHQWKNDENRKAMLGVEKWVFV